MEAIIKVPSSEFTEDLFKKIAALLKGKNAEITISVLDSANLKISTEKNEQFWNRLDESIAKVEAGKAQIFSQEELESFVTT